jgi:hypothetical protein
MKGLMLLGTPSCLMASSQVIITWQNFPKSKNIYHVVPHENLIKIVNFPMILVKYHGGK